MGARHGHNYAKDATLTEEGTGGEDGGDEGLLGRGDHVAGGVVLDVGGGRTEETEEVLHGGDTRDGTGIITEEDTGEGSEGDHEDTGELVLGCIGTDAGAGRSRTASHCEGVWGWRWTVCGRRDGDGEWGS